MEPTHDMENLVLSNGKPLITAPLTGVTDLERHWNHVDVYTVPHAKESPYITGFAASDRCVEAALRLRYEVFNLELGEGLAGSAISGLDRDLYDKQMTHLILMESATGHIVGTYRIQAARIAVTKQGLYSATLFNFVGFEPYIESALEVGRACLAQNHRTLPAIIMLWTGLGVFMNLYDLQHLFGCCSLTTQDPDDGWRAMKTIRAKGYLHPTLHMFAKPECNCGPPDREFAPTLGEAIPLPKLFRTYMRMGTQVFSGPAIDREFGTVDFLVMMDGKKVALSQLDILK